LEEFVVQNAHTDAELMRSIRKIKSDLDASTLDAEFTGSQLSFFKKTVLASLKKL
jgi:hypothetical protein